MQALQFPMQVTHRDNPHAVVTVATQDQYDSLPDEYKLQGVGEPLAASAIPGVNLDMPSAVSAEDDERRKSLDEAVDEFTAHVQAEDNRLNAARAQLDADRAALTEQQEALARERAEFEAQRAAAAGTGDIAGAAGAASSTPEDAATGDTATPPAAPAKRTRAANKEGA
jgi:hypothetical protein